MVRYVSHGVEGNPLKYLVYDLAGEKVYNLDVILRDNGKMVRLLEKEGQELGFVYITTCEQDSSVWIGLHDQLVGSVCFKKRAHEFCITIPHWSVSGNPYNGDFSIVKSGAVKVAVTAMQRDGVPSERLDISDGQDEHLILLLVLAIEEAVIGRKKKMKSA